MRLTCPNCDAQYEVPKDVVPTEGRDVQCSNCGQTWFQHHADHIPEDDASDLTDDTVAVDEETTPPEPEPVQEEEVVAPPPPPPAPAPPHTREENKGLDDLDDLPADSAPRTPRRKELDAGVADILRQEAESEQQARGKRTSDPLESQPDLGLPDTDDDDDSDRRTLEARQRMARLRGDPEPMSDADVNAAAISSRRDLLPDIDEINSTLRTENNRGGSANGQAEMDAPTIKKRKRGFRRGFFMMLVLFAILAAIYAYAPQIAQAVPQLDPVLNAYVAGVDQLRQWLDGHVQNLLRWLDTVASNSAS